MSSRNKSHATTITHRADGSHRVYYWIYDHNSCKFIRKSKDFSPQAVKQGKDLTFARDRDGESKLPQEISLSIEDRIILARFRKFGDLNDVLKFLEANYRASNSQETLKSAFDAFIREKTRTNRRPRTISDYNLFKNKLVKYHNMQLKDFGSLIAEKIIAMERTDSRRIKMATCLSSLFNWCIRKKLCAENPFFIHTKSDVIKDKEHISVFSPQEASAFLSYLPPTMKAGYAVMLFAGVRPAEMFNDDEKPVLTWNDVNFEKRTILIRAESSKTHSARVLHNLPENLWEWLGAYKKNTGKIFEISAGRIAKNRREACASAGVKFDNDICRHSFASHGYYFLGAEHTVKIMGHVGGFSTFAKHYEGISNPDIANDFFKITPANTPSKWIRKTGGQKKKK